MSVQTEQNRLEGVALSAWRSYLQSHAAILRELDTELVAEHGMTTHDYEVLLYLAQADEQRLAMSDLSQRTMLTRSGITRLIDGLVRQGFVERVSCDRDARVSYAHLTATGRKHLVAAGKTHVGSVERLFVARYSAEELELLSELLGRLPGATGAGQCCAAEDTPCGVVEDSTTPCAIDDTAAPTACSITA